MLNSYPWKYHTRFIPIMFNLCFLDLVELSAASKLSQTYYHADMESINILVSFKIRFRIKLLVNFEFLVTVLILPRLYFSAFTYYVFTERDGGVSE